MKKIIALLLLLGLGQMVLAQGLIPPPIGGGSGNGNSGSGSSGSGFSSGNIMTLGIGFSPLPGSAGTNQPSGSANYGPFGIGIDFLSQTTLAAGNLFYITVGLGTNQATDGWVYEKKDDGSFQPVMELTNKTSLAIPVDTNVNVYNPASTVPNVGFPQSFVTYYYYAQNWPLTVDQLQSLEDGKWYVEVDYGDDKYFGNLTPSFIEPPTATITVSPITAFPSGINIPPWNNTAVSENNNTFGEVVVAPARNRPATVILSGSESTDPFYLPLQFTWSDGTHLLAGKTNIVTTRLPGTYQISLEANDGINTSSVVLTLKVISPEEAVSELDSMVEQSYRERRTMRLLSSMLLQAERSFERRDARSGSGLLRDFQNQVRLQRRQTDSETENWLTEGAQNVIDATEGETGRWR